MVHVQKPLKYTGVPYIYTIILVPVYTGHVMPSFEVSKWHVKAKYSNAYSEFVLCM